MGGMNKQQGPNRIEWTEVYGPGTGLTWNPVAGCWHACRWRMADGSVAQCYAEDVAEGVAQAAYPQGFEHHYWRPDVLDAPLTRRARSGIFISSMGDLLGAWVPDEQIHQVLDVVRGARQHTFFLLTKNAPRLPRFNAYYPANLWVGVSSPPTFMMGKELSDYQQQRMLIRGLRALSETTAPVRWMSFEPLAFDVAPVIREALDEGILDYALEWAVIGAASKGRIKYQPDPDHVRNLLALLDARGTAVFFKNNLHWPDRRMAYPAVQEQVDEQQLKLF